MIELLLGLTFPNTGKTITVSVDLYLNISNYLRKNKVKIPWNKKNKNLINGLTIIANIGYERNNFTIDDKNGKILMRGIIYQPNPKNQGADQ